MNDSILESIKALLGPDSAYTVFDQDILIHINTALATLTQIGVGPANGFRITGSGETWHDFIGDRDDLDSVKTYVYCRVKMVFDPPTNQFLMNAMKETCDEIVWRLNVAVDPGNYIDE